MKLIVKFQSDKNHFFTLQIKYKNRNELYHLNSVSEANGLLEPPMFLNYEQQYKRVSICRSIVSYYVFALRSEQRSPLCDETVMPQDMGMR